MSSPADSPWAPLRRNAFRWLWIASLVSNLGAWMQTVGAQWLLVEGDASNLVISLVQTASSLPVLLLTVPAGVVAEFVDRRRMLIGLQAFQVAIAAALTLLTITGAITPILLLTFTFLLGCGAAAQLPAYQAFVPDLVPRVEIRAAASLSSLGINLARSLGPAIAGALVPVIGVGGVFGLNVLTFVVFGVALVFTPAPPAPTGARQAFLSGLQAGGRYVRNAPRVRRILLRLVLFAFPASVVWSLLAPLAHDQLGLGSAGYGVLLGAAGVGSVAGALLMPQLRRRLSATAIVAASGVVFGLSMIVVGAVRWTPVVIAALLVGGVAWIAVIAGMNAATQAFLPAWVRARALSIYQVVLYGTFTLAAIAWGALANRIGLTATFVTAGVLLLAGAATALRWPLLDRDIGSRETSQVWPLPEVTMLDRAEADPVLVSQRYHVPTERQLEFFTAMTDVKRSRLRTGATSWELYRDGGDPDSFIEQFSVPTWADHIAQHQSRMTEFDATVEHRVESAAARTEPAAHWFLVKR